MFNITGSIRIIPYNDIGRVRTGPNTRIVSISDADIPNTPIDLKASILLPPYEAMSAFLDNNREAFFNIYMNYLNSGEVKEYILAVILAAFRGKDILFIVGPEESNMDFPIIFIEYMKQYGIMMGDSMNPGGFDQSGFVRILIDLYMFNLIGWQEFMYEYPADIRLEPFPGLIEKLIMELNPYIADRSYNSYLEYFNRYKDNVKGSNRPLVNAMNLAKKG